ncbi:hypothetical protein J3F84DRAFT_1364 [Trichoderma pleuroticola]
METEWRDCRGKAAMELEGGKTSQDIHYLGLVKKRYWGRSACLARWSMYRYSRQSIENGQSRYLLHHLSLASLVRASFILHYLYTTRHYTTLHVHMPWQLITCLPPSCLNGHWSPSVSDITYCYPIPTETETETQLPERKKNEHRRAYAPPARRVRSPSSEQRGSASPRPDQLGYSLVSGGTPGRLARTRRDMEGKLWDPKQGLSLPLSRRLSSYRCSTAYYAPDPVARLLHSTAQHNTAQHNTIHTRLTYKGHVLIQSTTRGQLRAEPAG